MMGGEDSYLRNIVRENSVSRERSGRGRLFRVTVVGVDGPAPVGRVGTERGRARQPIGSQMRRKSILRSNGRKR